jgi:hypothetical protein
MIALMTGYVRRHHVGVIALFIALGGTSYAAVKLPANSVGSKQIKTNAVRSAEVKNKSLKPEDFAAGTLLQGPSGPRGATGPAGPRGPQGPPFVPDIFVDSNEASSDQDKRLTDKRLTVNCGPGTLAMGGYIITPVNPPLSGSIAVVENREVFDDNTSESSWAVDAREVGVGAGESWTLRVEANCVVVG